MKKILSLACLAAAACLAAPAAMAQFSAEKRISTIAGVSVQPVVAAVGSNVYIAWVEDSGSMGQIYFSRSVDNGATFSAPVPLTATPSRPNTLPVIAAGGTQVHIFWTDSVVNGDVYHRRSTDSGATFAAEVKRTVTDAFYSRPSSALVDSGGRVHFAYYDNKPDGYGQVYYQCSSDQGASFTTAVNLNEFDGVVDHETPRLAQGTDGTLYLLMRSNRLGFPQGGWGPADQYLLRTNAPLSSCTPTWLRPSQRISAGVPEEFASTYGALLSAGPSNILHAAWWSGKAGSNLVYRRGFPNGKGWETPIDISQFGVTHPEWDGSAAELSDFGLNDDGANSVHAVFGDNNHSTEGFLSGSVYYRCSANGGATWGSRSVVATSTNTAQPRAAYSNGRFHMVWMDWRDNFSGAEIYYRNVSGACGSAGGTLAEVMDLNGDARSDVLFRNTSSGALFRLFANGLSLTSGAVVYTEPNTTWRIVGDGDFNGDGVRDLLWRNTGSGQVYVMPFNSSGVPTAGGVVYTEPSSSWKIVATPDLNGDGKSDILWRNTANGQVWGVLLNGTSVLAQGNVYNEPNTQWQIVGVGDLAGTGKENQIVYRNTATGVVYLLTVSYAGSFTTSGQVIYNEPNLAWTIVATGDFNGDGRTDLVYRNSSTGQVFVLLMNGGTVTQGGQYHVEPSASWVIISTGDYNGDGRADMLWRNTSSGLVYMMLTGAGGLTVQQQGTVYSEPNTTWRVMGPPEYVQ